MIVRYSWGMPKMPIVLIIHDVRSCHNVGSLLRSADGFGVEHVYLTGYSPYPKENKDIRLPYVYERAHKQIHKTALGAERSVSWSHHEDIAALISDLLVRDFQVVALELTKASKPLAEFRTTNKVALIVGNEVTGLNETILKIVSARLMIPMLGKKESFNVSVAGAIALYHLAHIADQL
jgi:23S rRNA (guanosine2251-2'-O)-methyltransferase